MIVLAGIVAGQAILYGPSLAGRKILLPLDLLACPSAYLPIAPGTTKFAPHDYTLSDLVFQWEPARRFAVAEFHASRLPMWDPCQYAGAPSIWPKFSPFLLLEGCIASPVILAWAQLFAAVVAGLGAYLFFRRALAVGFWAAAIPAWCYPLTGFFVLWQGYPTSGAVHWLPWLLLMVDRTIRRASPWAAIGTSLITGLALTSGALDVAGQVLLVSGLYAIWCWLDAYRNQWLQRPARWPVLAVTLGWLLGFLLAAPYWLPTLEYAQTGARMERRSSGAEERPPTGLSALPQTVLPDIYGASRTGSLRIVDQNEKESSAATYAGLLATLWVAPLAWCSRRHRSVNGFWCLLGFLGLSWCLNVPGLVQLWRLPGLNMMSHNRLVIATTFAILAMTAVGLDALRHGEIRRHRWFGFPVAVLAGLYLWCFYRSLHLPEPIATQIRLAVTQGKWITGISDPGDVQRVQAWFTWSYIVAMILCGLGLLGWLMVWLRPAWPKWAVPALGLLLVADLLWFAHDRRAQCDPALYYPPIPVLEQVAKSTPGRIIGVNCLPATLARMLGLRDLRGYDAVDPARLMDLMMLAASPDSPAYPYALTQWFVPRLKFEPPDGIRISPLLDLLDVRYLIFRATPPPGIHPAFQGPDYWVLLNHHALPRVFVPRHVEMVADRRERLEKLASPGFDPLAMVYVETPVNLPDACRGQAEIVAEIPMRVTVSVRMETPGLVVLADLWDKGWKADVNGRPAQILRANHAVRGVVVPAGASTLEFQYAPDSFTRGLWLSGLAAVILLGWSGIIVWSRRQPSQTSHGLPLQSER